MFASSLSMPQWLSGQFWRNVAKGWRTRYTHSKLDTMMEGIENDDLSLRPVEEEDFPTNPHLDEDPNGWQTISPEHMSIFMPSCLHISDIQRLGLVTMASQELELRQGQANDALEGLRLALGHKTLLF